MHSIFDPMRVGSMRKALRRERATHRAAHAL
jgi:hypothetical protein